jgi:hypothetical protein
VQLASKPLLPYMEAAVSVALAAVRNHVVVCEDQDVATMTTQVKPGQTGATKPDLNRAFRYQPHSRHRQEDARGEQGATVARSGPGRNSSVACQCRQREWGLTPNG